VTNVALARERARELADVLRRLEEYALNAHLAINAGLLQEAAEELNLAEYPAQRFAERLRETRRLIELARADAEASAARASR
jgi:hypothetical protein